mgnify:CR=1 FL=1
MSKYDYNVVVVGGGTAGLISAYVANLLGAKTALIEANKMGGDCLNTGCVPSKSLIASARAAAGVKEGKKYGIHARLSEIDYTSIHERVHSVIRDIEPADSAERYRKLGIEVIEEKAEWVDGHTVKVGDKKITARRIVISTGSKPRVLGIPGEDLPHVKTSDTIWDMETLPKAMVIIGGGPIGLELSMAYAQLGVKVTILESNPTVLQMLTEEQREPVLNSMKESGIDIRTEVAIKEITNDAVKIKGDSIAAEIVISAAGRTPNTHWLENSPVTLDKRGYVKVDSSLNTSISSIYACGDVTGGFQFTHVAGYEAGYAGSNAAIDWTFFKRKPAYNAIPWSIYSSPEISHVGVLANDAKKGHNITHVPLEEIDRAKTDGKTEGGIWLVSDKKGKVLGATIIASQASSLIGEATLAVQKGLSVNDIFGTIHAYPSYGDAYSKVAGKWKNDQTNPKVLKLLKRLMDAVR